MGERTEYELPGAQGPAYFICGIWRRNGQPYDDLAALLNAAQAHYEAQAVTAAEGLAAVRRIRVEAGLGVLEWTTHGDGCRRARAANGLVRYEVAEMRSEWTADDFFSDTPWTKHPTEAAAKAACEQWFAAWLERAGLEVRR